MAATNLLLPSKAPGHLQGLQRIVKQTWAAIPGSFRVTKV